MALRVVSQFCNKQDEQTGNVKKVNVRSSSDGCEIQLMRPKTTFAPGFEYVDLCCTVRHLYDEELLIFPLPQWHQCSKLVVAP